MMDMPKPRLPYVQREKTRHGRLIWVFRIKKGKRTRLPDEYGSPEFMKAYKACLVAEPKQHERPLSPHGSLKWLVEQWMESSDWLKCSQATKRQRENILIRVLSKAGDVKYIRVTQKHIQDEMERRKHTRFAANNFLKTMRALFKWAIKSQLTKENPAANVEMFSKQTDGFPPWTDRDVSNYRQHWPVGTRERLAMELILSTGLRRGDAVTLGRQHVRNGIAKITSEKTNVDLYVVIDGHLQAIIDQSPTGDLSFICGQRGKPLKKEAFGTWFRNACRAAGVQASAHGLRKLAAATLAEKGGTETELQAKFGWRSGRQSEIYTRSASQKAMAIQAARKLKK